MDDEGRLFTVEEVDALIPRLEFIMARMQRNALELRSALEAAAAARGSAAPAIELHEVLEQRPELRELVAELERCITEIEDYGGQFKGLELGLVDFPSRIDGQIGLLCWQYGEKEISHWHSFEDGFAGRQRLPGGAYLTLQ
ncbi:MAG: DUF2203 domain-containing protein [Candidatus Binatia bacterium]